MEDRNIIIDFVSGGISIAEFMSEFLARESLQNFMQDNLPEKLINQGEIVRSEGLIFDCFDNIKWNTIYGSFVMHSLCMDWLEGNNISCDTTNRYGNDFSFFLKVIPNYVGGEQAEFVVSEIIEAVPQNLSKTQKIKWCKDKIKEHFRYDSRPPRWVQSPEWPMNEHGKPLVFRGQSKDDVHSELVKFYFYDPDSGKEAVVEQLY